MSLKVLFKRSFKELFLKDRFKKVQVAASRIIHEFFIYLIIGILETCD